MRTISTYATLAAASVALAATAAAPAQTFTGPSTAQSPYVVPLRTGVTTTSILSVGEGVDGYRMAGIPDGLGAFDNGDGTFTVLMHHELRPTAGILRDHNRGLPANDPTTGQPTPGGAYVSKWVIDKATLAVRSGDDLIKTVNEWNGSAYAPTDTRVFNRFCSADLAPLSGLSFTQNGTTLGTTQRLFLGGEETSAGKAYATVVSTGAAYQLPKLGSYAFENVLVNPASQLKTIVAGMDDSANVTSAGPVTATDPRPSEVYFYVGTKTQAANPIEAAGLNNGQLFGVKVDGATAEDRLGGIGGGSKTFTLAAVNPEQGELGLQNESIEKGVTQFLRVEDGAWNPTDPSEFFFTTTDQFSEAKEGTGDQEGRSRLWKMTFADLTNPQLGGRIEALLDGTEPHQMLDNMDVDAEGRVILQEDTGNQPHNAKVWMYTPGTDALTLLAGHDVARFGDNGVPATAPFTQDEESSGIIDVSEILGEGWYLLDVEAHGSTPFDPALLPELVEGGQLLAMYVDPNAVPAAVPVPAAALIAPAAMAVAGFAGRRMRRGK